MKIINWGINYSMMFLIITYVSKYCKVNCEKRGIFMNLSSLVRSRYTKGSLNCEPHVCYYLEIQYTSLVTKLV
nr:MAG TPA: hypothetical protein [Caudoviricetes sp.]